MRYAYTKNPKTRHNMRKTIAQYLSFQYYQTIEDLVSKKTSLLFKKYTFKKLT